MKGKLVKVAKIVLQILLYFVLAVCLLAVIVATTTKRDENGAKTVFGHQLRIVLSDSMAECELTDVSEYEIGSLPTETLLLVEVVPTDKEKAEEWYSQLKKGDVLTFRYQYDLQVTITHRIAEDPVKKETGGYIIKLEGDNKTSESESERMYQTIDTSLSETSSNYVIGKVVGASYPLGKFIYILKQPVGIVCVIIIPALIVIIMEVVRIVSVLNEEKRKKAEEAVKVQEDEIEELKKQIAALSQAIDEKTEKPEKEGEEAAGQTPSETPEETQPDPQPQTNEENKE
ncbi:MAG: hypothetical protein IJX81_02230 [Clostridia bacterium]|nr:hypothetical protein [Clostridia bacterium]